MPRSEKDIILLKDHNLEKGYLQEMKWLECKE
jgi:hypothetical protein